MKVDYLQVLKDSFAYTMKYKVLWIFGFLLALFASGGSSGSNSYNSPNSSNNSSRSSSLDNMPIEWRNFLTDAQTWLTNLIHQPGFWIAVVIFVLFCIVLFFIGIYISTISNTALINAVKHDNARHEQNINVKYLWNEASGIFWKVLGYKLLWGIVIGLGMVFVALPMVFMFVIPIFICLAFIYIPIFIVAIWFAGKTVEIGEKILILENGDIVGSLSLGFYRLKNDVKGWFIASLATIIPALIVFIPYILVFIILMLILIGLPIVYLYVSVVSVGSIVVFVLGCILFWLACGAISAPYNVFTVTYWTKMFYILSEKADSK